MQHPVKAECILRGFAKEAFKRAVRTEGEDKSDGHVAGEVILFGRLVVPIVPIRVPSAGYPRVPFAKSLPDCRFHLLVIVVFEYYSCSQTLATYVHLTFATYVINFCTTLEM